MRTHRRNPVISTVLALAVPALLGGVAASCGSGVDGTGDSSNPTQTGAGGHGAEATTASQSTSGTGTGGTGQGGGTGGVGQGGTGGVGQGGGGNAQTGCTGDDDCTSSPIGKVCDMATGDCVGCLPSSDACADGQFCDPATKTCVTGCADDTDCANDPNGYTHCDVPANTCVACLTDEHCGPGTICSAADGNICVPGCTPTHDCQMGFTCCTGTCFDVMSDFEHCGSCDTPCVNPANATVQCVNGVCGMQTCNADFADCNGISADGCEQDVLLDGPCLCVPGTTQPCYEGSPGTQDVGPCKGGTQACAASGTAWGACIGQVLAQPEICANGIDEDCDGIIDDVPDVDGDGWTACDGDCCETVECPSPTQVNPGAFEVLNNAVDDDCDVVTSDVAAPAACSSVAAFTGVTAVNLANAMDICQTTTLNAPLPTKKWGLITASTLLANANGLVASAAELSNEQAAVLENYGTSAGNNPKKATTMGGLSSGMMRDKSDAGYAAPNPGTTNTSQIAFSPIPANPLGHYLNSHGGNLVPGKCGNTTCPTGTSALDSVMVRLTLRTPTNAGSFSYDFKFFSAEYKTYQCTSFNDHFLAMLTTGAAGVPADHSISFGLQNRPISVNSEFLTICSGNGKNCNACPDWIADLAGTGMEDGNTGGATMWLTTDAPIVPGETMVLELMVFDVGDDQFDSLVLLDNFRWNMSPAVVSTHP